MNVYIPSSGFATQGPAPAGFHVPIYNEWSGLKTIMDGLSITANNWRKYLHMPFVGRRSYSSSDISNQGERGYYWCSTSGGNSYPEYARELYLDSASVTANDFLYRAYGFSVRCFKDSFEAPTSSWTVITGTLGGAGIFRNQTEGLISITSNGTTGYTIMDKNLGATTVYNDGDTLTQANMGNMYQWGNNYGFPSTGTISKTSSTRVNASTYGPSTTNGYYESDTFIKYTGDWSSVKNDNLRGGTSGNVNITTMKELQNAYIGEVYEYSYDFRNKSVSQVQNDGWTFQEGSGTVAFNANGVYLSNTSYNLRMWNVKGPWTNANKITMTMTATVGTGSATFKLSTSNNADTNSTGINIDSNGNKQVLAIYGTGYSFSGLSSGTYTQKVVLDLVNKTYTLSCTGKSDNTGSITDAQIAGLKANAKTVGVYIWNVSTGTVIRDIKILVE